MNPCRGSAIVLSMLLLIILSAIGMYVVSVPVGTGENADRHHRTAVARNMARAGANAAIAQYSRGNPGGSQYSRRIPVGPNIMGSYSVSWRRAGARIVPGPVSRFEEFDLVSVGSVTDLTDVEARVEARIRYEPDPVGPKFRIIMWKE